MDVASWLRSLGLEQYEATFRDNAIDDGVLPDLTDQDLEKLGVLLGHRRKLLRAIATMVESEDRRRSGGAAIWRTGHRQVSTDGGAARASERRAAHEDAILLLATAHR